MNLICKKGNYIRIGDKGQEQRFTPWTFEVPNAGFKFISTQNSKRLAQREAQEYFKRVAQ